ncbi:MAG: iron-containing alcohol dehydrogenase [Acutalibacteraceae bacterium]|nr:iron-containing alcohol dehydrogenase [Acutalibacteraceae bacterium]
MIKIKSVTEIIKEFEQPCPCGREHRTAVQDVRIGSGLVKKVGEILKKNGFPKNILLVADKNTLAAAKGVEESLKDFSVEYKIYDEIRVARMEHVEELESIIRGRDIGVLSVGTGSVNDPCRLAAARQDKKLCIFATAPSMDGFASYSSPIVANGFKASYPAKSPEVIIGDTKILAAAPAYLKSAGFGDMVAKYIGLADWKISSILTDEVYCEKVAKLTRDAVDKLMSMADRVTQNDEETAGEIFKSLLMTGIGMSFMQNSRPASGSEHIISHLLECVELRDGIIPNYHGEDIGVCTLLMLKYYNELADKETIKAKKEKVDWADVYSFYAEMADDVRKLNEPKTATDEVDLKVLEDKWQEIREIIHNIPSYDEVYSAMKKAGCKLTVEDIGKSQELVDSCIKYSPYMRYRLTLLRLRGMIE